MKYLIVAMLFISANASADSCSSKNTGPCTPGIEQKTAIMAAIQAGFAAQKDVDADKIDAVQAREAGKFGMALKILQNELDDRQEMRANYNEAIRLTEKYYHLTPATPSGEVASPKGPGKNPGADWATGEEVKWSPRFYSDSKFYFKIPGSDKKEHYGGVDDIEGGFTGANGETVINSAIFQSAIDDNNPGDLAYLIHHEAFHFMELTHRGWDNPDEGEIRAYKESLATLKIFELDDPPQCLNQKEGCWRKTFDAQIAGRVADLKGPKKNFTPMFPDDELSDRYKKDFNNYESDEKRLVREIQDLKPLAEAEQGRIKDASLKASLGNIAIRACENPLMITQRELDALPQPYSPNFFVGDLPHGVGPRGSCASKIFLSLSMDFQEGGRPSVDTILKILNPLAPPPPATPALAIDYDRKWGDVKALAVSACDDGPYLSSDGIAAALFLHHCLVDPNERSYYRSVSWEAQGLTGCASWVYASIVQNIEHDNFGHNFRESVDESVLIESVNQVAREHRPPPPPPVVRPDPQPQPQPNPNPRPRPNPVNCSCSVVGGIRVCPGRSSYCP